MRVVFFEVRPSRVGAAGWLVGFVLGVNGRA